MLLCCYHHVILYNVCTSKLFLRLCIPDKKNDDPNQIIQYRIQAINKGTFTYTYIDTLYIYVYIHILLAAVNHIRKVQFIIIHREDRGRGKASLNVYSKLCNDTVVKSTIKRIYLLNQTRGNMYHWASLL